MSTEVINPTEIFLPRQHQVPLDMDVIRAMVFSPTSDEIMVCQRESGVWEFPGGQRAPGETRRDAAVREVFEETKVRILAVDEPIQFNKDKEREFVRNGITRFYREFITVGSVRQSPGLPIPQPGEVQDVKWIELYNASHIISKEVLKFRIGTVAAMTAMLPSIQNSKGTLVRQSIERIIETITGHEVEPRVAISEVA